MATPRQFSGGGAGAAFPLEEMNRIAERVGQHLKFNVPRPLDEALQKDTSITEGVERFTPRRA